MAFSLQKPKVFSLDNPQDFERRLFKNLMLISLSVHGAIIGAGIIKVLWLAPAPILPEVAVEAILVDDFSTKDKAASISKAKKGKELKVAKRTLPQTPDRILKQAKVIVDSTSKERMSGAEVETKKVGTSEFSEQKPDKSAKEKKRLKQVALKRLLMEEARRKKKFAKQHESPLDKTLKARKKSLQQRFDHQSGIRIAGAKGVNTQYSSTLKQWINRYYSLPESYAFKKEQLKVVLHLIISKNGDLIRVKISKPSADRGFDRIALATLEKASPFPKPPQDWANKVITVPFSSNSLGN